MIEELKKIQWENGNVKTIEKLIKAIEGTLSLAQAEENDIVINSLENDIKQFKELLPKLSNY